MKNDIWITTNPIGNTFQNEITKMLSNKQATTNMDWSDELTEHDIRVPYHCCCEKPNVNFVKVRIAKEDIEELPGIKKGELIMNGKPSWWHPIYKNTIIPHVKKVEIYNERVVKVTFVDDTFTKSVCSPNDRFDIDVGITICLMKRWLGKDGNKLYNNMLRDIHKTMEHNEKVKEKEAEEKRERKRKQRKEELKKAAKKAKERQEQIDIRKTAIIEAMREVSKSTGDDLK